MKGRISIAVLVMTMSAFAQTVNLKGVVKDRVSENPIKDAIVQIQGKSIADTTDSLGQFSFSFKTSAKYNKPQLDVPISPHFISNRGIVFSIKQAADIRVEIISLAGKIIKTFVKSSMESGAWAFSPGSLSSGTYLSRIRIGNTQTIVKFISNGQNSRGQGVCKISNYEVGQGALTKMARIQSIFDTIRVLKDGYYAKNITWL